MLLCRLKNELWCCHEGREVNDSKNIITYCPHVDVSYFPFPRATKEIGDVCTQAKQNIANALKKGKGRRQKVNTLGLN